MNKINGSMTSQRKKEFIEKKTNVFIGWSGKRSKELANYIWDWLPKVIQAINPWMSETDIFKGDSWKKELDNQLKDAEIGVFCLTPENRKSDWIAYEATKLSSKNSRVCPYLLELEHKDIMTLPIGEYQSTLANKEDTRELIRSINVALGNKVLDKNLNENFDKYWPELEENIEKIPKASMEVELSADRKKLEVLLSQVTEIKNILEKSSFENSMFENVEMNSTANQENLSVDLAVKDLLINLASDYKQIKNLKYNDYNNLYVREAETKLWDVIDYFSKLKNGHLVVSRERGLYILQQLIENTQKTIFATSIIPIKDFWLSPWGKRYSNANEKAQKKGVKIKRIFIKHDNLDDKEMVRYNDLINEQVNSNIRVKEAERHDLPDELLKDFAILDDKLVFYLHFKDPDKNNSIPTIDHADIYVDRFKIDEASNKFKEIDSYAKYICENTPI